MADVSALEIDSLLRNATHSIILREFTLSAHLALGHEVSHDERRGLRCFAATCVLHSSIDKASCAEVALFHEVLGNA